MTKIELGLKEYKLLDDVQRAKILEEHVIKEFFLNSYVKCKGKLGSNNYIVRGNKITMQYDNLHDSNTALLHEMSHFVIAPMKRLLLNNWGYDIGNPSNDTWYDLNIEVQVYALEYNLAKYFGVPMSTNSWNILDNLQGWQNYKRIHQLTKTQMLTKVKRAYNHWCKVYTIKWFKNEWSIRNKYLHSLHKKSN